MCVIVHKNELNFKNIFSSPMNERLRGLRRLLSMEEGLFLKKN